MKPILFSTPMVKAILEDRKNMTRRVINPQPVINPEDKRQVSIPVNRMHGMIDTLGFYSVEDYIKHKAPYQPGDVLWVRETWAERFDGSGRIYYRADDNLASLVNRKDDKWKPSLFMPLRAARIFLRVTDVRVERLQDITEEDARDEGVKDPYEYQAPEYYDQPHMRGLEINKSAFAGLWDSLNGKRGYSWKSNPWLWVYTFERCEKPGN
jgi:hypothetical protein